MRTILLLILLANFYTPVISQYHLDFDGSSSYVSFDQSVIYGKSEFTIELWVMPDDVPTSTYSSLIGENDCVEFGFYNGQIHAWLEGTESGGSHVTTSISVGSDLETWEGTWHHLALVADGSNVIIYADGEEINNSAFAVNDFRSSGTQYNLSIGAFAYSTFPYYFDGSLDEVRIWDKALSADDIRMAMCQEIVQNSGNIQGEFTGESSPGSLSWTNDLECYFDMNNLSNELLDATSPSVNGDLQNINGLSRSSQTTPLPYESDGNGVWTNASTWLSNQTEPQNKWAIVDVKNNVNVNRDEVARWVDIDAGDRLRINSNRSLTVTDAIVNNGTFRIKENGSLVQLNTGSDNNSGTGEYKIERSGNNSELTYNIWSSPVQNASITSTFSGVNPCDVYVFDGTIQNWKYDYASGFNATCNGNNVTFSSSDVWSGGDGIMNPGVGYFIPGNASNTKKTFEGDVNNADISVSIYAQNNPGGVNWTGDNWNLLGNPYPSAIDIMASNSTSFASQNSSAITGDIYFWVDDASSGSGYNASQDYAVYNSTGGVSANGSEIPDGYIASGQGFWVIATSTQSVVFNNAMRDSENKGNFFKQAEHPKIWLDLTNDKNQINQILVGLTDASSRDYDMGYDAPKAEGNALISFASVVNEEYYSIQAVPAVQENDSTGVELYVNAGYEGVHFISLSNTENLTNEYDLYLLDAFTGKTHNLNAGPYSFYVSQPGEFKQRFYLQVNRGEENIQTSIIEQTNDLEAKIRIAQDGNLVFIDGSDALVNLDAITVYDLQGKVVKRLSSKSMNVSWDTNGVAVGVYTIVVESERGTVVKKIVVR